MPPPINIGALLTYEQRKEIADLNFKPGAVFRFFCLIAQKDKFFVFCGNKFDKTKIALLHINTEINPNIFPTQALKNEHILIKKDDYGFLGWDSYINCTAFIIRETEEIYSLIVNNPSFHKGNLSADFFTDVKQKICKSKILTRDKKKEFGLFFC